MYNEMQGGGKWWEKSLNYQHEADKGRLGDLWRQEKNPLANITQKGKQKSAEHKP